MSTSHNCILVETEPEKWYFILENNFARKDAWDWLDDAWACGPFDSEPDAREGVLEYASPGGSVVLRQGEANGRIMELISHARKHEPNDQLWTPHLKLKE